jgi:signal transduction histidine kinase
MWDRLRRVDRRVGDALLALLMLVGALVGLFLGRRTGDTTGSLAVGVVLAAGATVPLAWRRRAPLIVLGVVIVSDWLVVMLDYGAISGFAAVIALYTAAAYCERRRLVPVLVPLLLFWATDMVVQDLNWMEVLLAAVLMAGIPIGFGRIVFNRRVRVARERDLAAREAVSDERARIARELHDVVAHHMSVMVVQAAAARAVADKDPTAAGQALRQIEESGRAGLTEMRRLLDLLKSEEGEQERVPQPGLERLDELLQTMRATGLSVERIVEGSPHALPSGVDLSAYRIVQEALTNTLKHAGDAHARVLLRFRPDALEIEVADDGRGASAPSAAGAGRGLIGMRERVQLFGGTLESGPRPGGGFVVRARLPVLEETLA